MRKIIIIAIAVLLAFTACKKNNDNAPKANKKLKIGVAKLISHPALDLIEDGVIDEIVEQGFDVDFDRQNANGEITVNAEIANNYKTSKPDLVIAITTTTALAMSQHIKDIPVVFVAVSDPVGSGVRKTLEPYDTNVTGAQDMPPLRDEILMIRQVLPNIKKLGHVYSPGEANSVMQLKIIEQVCKELNIELITATVNNTAEVKQATEVIAPKVEAIFVSKDNFVVSALPSLTDTAYVYKVPVFSADPTSAPAARVTVAHGLDSYKTGRFGGKVAARVLRGEKPANIPVKNVDEFGIYINKTVADSLGIKIPQELLDKADLVE